MCDMWLMLDCRLYCWTLAATADLAEDSPLIMSCDELRLTSDSSPDNAHRSGSSIYISIPCIQQRYSTHSASGPSTPRLRDHDHIVTRRCRRNAPGDDIWHKTRLTRIVRGASSLTRPEA